MSYHIRYRNNFQAIHLDGVGVAILENMFITAEKGIRFLPYLLIS